MKVVVILRLFKILSGLQCGQVSLVSNPGPGPGPYQCSEALQLLPDLVRWFHPFARLPSYL